MLTCLLWNTLVACILAGFVFIVTRWRRVSPAMRHGLWLVVILKLLSPLGLIWEIQVPWPQSSDEEGNGLAATMDVARPLAFVGASNQPPLEVFTPADDERVSTVLVVQACDPAIMESVTRSETEVVPATTIVANQPTKSPIPWAYWLLILWGAGALLMARMYLIQTWQFARYARRGTIANGWLTRQVAAMAEKIGVRVPEIRVVVGLPSPVVWCLWRPVLLWPKGLENQLSQEGRNTILTHELAHLRRRDHWVRWLELFAAIVHWWNPLFRIARRQLRFHAELACDAWVLGTLPENRRAYAEALIDVCQRSSMPAAPTPAVGVGGEGKKMLERRLTMIMKEQVPCRAATGARLFICLLAMAAIPAWTLGQSKPEPKPEPKPEKKLILGEDVEIEIIPDRDLQELLKKVEALRLGQATEKKPVPQDVQMKQIEAQIAELTAQLAKLKAAKAQATDTKKPAIDPKKPEGVKDEIRKTVTLRQLGQGDSKEPTVIVIGTDGKLIKDAKIIMNDGKEPTVIVIGPDGKQIKDVKIIMDQLKFLPDVVPPIPARVPFTVGERVGGTQGIKIVTETVDGKTVTKAFGADGKEIKDWKPGEYWKQADGVRSMTIPSFPYSFNNIAPARSSEPSSASKVVNLTRATYKLPKEKAEALEKVLKEMKASVMETKIDADGLTVTTTPDVQRTVESVIKLISGQPTTPNPK